MPLTCELGWHRADPLARWNDGYYFSKCTRCGRDLVRTAYQRWHVPKGYRVVWHPRPPEPGKAQVYLQNPSSLTPELPIQEVLKHLGGRDLSNDGGVGCVDEAEGAAIRSTRESVHAETLHVGEVIVEHVVVSEVRAQPTPEAENNGLDAELPFGDAAAPVEDAESVAEGEHEATDEPGATENPEPSVEPAASHEPTGDEPEASDLEEHELAPAENPPPAPAEASHAAQRFVIDDFMAEDPEPAPWDAPPPPRRREPEPHVEPARRISSEDAEEEASFAVPTLSDYDADGSDLPPYSASETVEPEAFPSVAGPEKPVGLIGKRFERKVQIRKLVRRNLLFAKARRAREAAGDWSGSLNRRLAVTGLVAAGVLVLVAVVAERPNPAPAAAPQAAPSAATVTPPAPLPKAKAQPARADPAKSIFPTRQRAFVTASIVNCRAAPVKQANSVKKLSRGAEVEIIAREAEWLSVSHRGRQCWTASRYVSPDRPA